MNSKLQLSVIALSTIILAGCLGQNQSVPEPTEDAQVFLKDTEIVFDQENELNTAIDATIPLEEVTTPTTESNPMQTTSDPRKPDQFITIPATSATIVTSKGPITVELYPDKVPLTVQNFLNLAEQKFYNGIVFHRVIEGFMAQVGDPLTKDPAMQPRWGSGGPGYTIADEFDPSLKHDAAGVLSMANAGPGTGGSQFFITYAPQPHLDGKHAVFGKVTDGMEILNSIEQGDVIETITYK